MNPRKRTILSLILYVVVFVFMAAISVFAEEGDPSVNYLDANGERITIEGKDYIKISSVSGSTFSTGTYVVDQNREFNDRVIINGNVKLILVNNTTLTCSKGISVTGTNNLDIYAQSNAGIAGKLIATGEEEAAGIGGRDEEDSGIITINGGYIEAKGGYRASGIGGGTDGSNYRVIINGGTVKAYGGGVKNASLRQSGGAGIGGGAFGYGGVILIRGGDVEAKGVWGGAGLGGGYGGSVTTVAISGDNTKVSANADKGAAAIGGGCSDGSDKGNAYNISIAGGEVDARIMTPSSGVAGAAIGSGDSGYAANIAITGGTVKAMSEYGNNGAAAIGGGNKGYFGNIRIEGGNITAVQAYGGAGIGSGSDSEKGSEQAVGKITISGGTIRSAAVTSYGYYSTGAGIGSGSSAESPVNIEITGGNINAYCAMDDGSGDKLDYSGAGIGSGYGSPMGLINISGGTILATRGKGCTKADPIGYYNDTQNSVYPSITFDYDKAQIRNEKGEGTDKRVKNTQYDSNENLSKRLALLENDSDWVEIKPCDHVGADYEIVSAGEDGMHKMNCEYCISEGGQEHTHAFDENNKCVCGYYRYTLTFKDGQEGGKSETAYAYPDLNSSGEVMAEKEIKISDYSPSFKVAGKEFDGWIIEGDESETVYPDSGIPRISANTTFIAQWKNLAGVKIVLSSIDGPIDQMSTEGWSETTRIADLLAADTVKCDLDALIGEQGAGYVVEKDLTGRPRYWASKPMSSFDAITAFDADLDSNATVAALGDSDILYVAVFKTIDKADIGIKAPVCGTQTKVEVLRSTNPPEFTAPSGAGYSVKGDDAWLLWLKSNNTKDTFTGTLTGGTDYYAAGIGIFAPDYGYAFSKDVQVTVDGGELMDKTVEGQHLSVIAKVKAVHDFGEWEEVIPATCTDKGMEQRHCLVDGCDGVETKETDIDTDVHDYGTPTYTWAADNSTVTAETVCSHNSEHKIKETVDTKSSITKEATCTEKGRTKYTAVFEDTSFTIQSKTIENIDATGHEWGAPAYEWASDNSTCTAKRVCVHDANHVDDETVNTTSEVTKEPTETEDGIMTYTASFTKDVFENQTKTVSIPKLKPEPTPTPAPSKKVSGALIAKATASGKKTLVFRWTKVSNAAGYDIFMSRCNYRGKKYTPKKIKTIKGNNTFTWSKRKLAVRTAYKAYVKAYVYVNGKKTYVRTSPFIHVFTSGYRGKLTNPMSVTINKTAASLKQGKTYRIRGSVKKLRRGKNLPGGHASYLRYLSSNNKVASVKSNGTVKAVGKGTCTVYVYAANGIWKTCKVTVH